MKKNVKQQQFDKCALINTKFIGDTIFISPFHHSPIHPLNFNIFLIPVFVFNVTVPISVNIYIPCDVVSIFIIARNVIIIVISILIIVLMA